MPAGYIEPMIGRRFSKLLVVSQVESRDKRGSRYFECACDCGGTIVAPGYALRRKKPYRSCGQCPKPSLRERLESNFIPEPMSGCFIWTGVIVQTGYGQLDGGTTAHRQYYELERGQISKGMHLDHLCRNRSCVNPAHLEVVTPRENILRGDGPAANNARKRFCKRGHPLFGDNVIVYRYPGSTHRYCRTCGAANSKLRRETLKSEDV